MAELCSDVSNLQKEMLALIRKVFSVRYLLYKKNAVKRLLYATKTTDSRS